MSEIIVVTGIPRSGTSLMMQILEKIPIEIMTDEVRQKDENNPEGYYELEAVKGIIRDNSFLREAQDKAIKIVAPLPQFLDLSLKYKVIFMRREMDEILISQEKMLNKDQSAEREKFKTIYELHIKKTYQFLELNKIPFIDIHYSNLVSNPNYELTKLIDFLNMDLDLEKLKASINQKYYRNRLL
ncbi:MAG: sulfotransferase domain-containing protein [Crocinitomicaceae bacterium]|jgi:hypothetical protein